MVTKIKQKILRFFGQRTTILLFIFILMSSALVGRIFHLQIVNGQEYSDNFTVMTTRKRVLQSTRGNIYDVNGKVLAYNKLSNSVTIEDNGNYANRREKNLSLNSEILQLTNLILSKGDKLSHDFHIYVDEDGNFAFDVEEGRTRDRFRADVYGRKLIEDMTEKEANSDADQIMEYLAGEERFALFHHAHPYTDAELSAHQLPKELSKQEILNIVIVRYELSLISYQRYVPVTVAEDVSDTTVAAVKESQQNFQGVKIEEDSKRVYNDAEAFAPIIGYTGKASADELSRLKQEDAKYTNNSIVGKTGIEQVMETTLQGTDGSEDITVNNLGKVLSVNENSRVNPTQGNDVFLTIDSELQQAGYKILEQRIAGIILSKLQNTKYAPSQMEDADNELYIPIYDVYNALTYNSILDISHFSAEDASETEKKVYAAFEQAQDRFFSWLESELTGSGTPYKNLQSDQKEYLDYIFNKYLVQDSGILNSKKMNKQDDTYKKYVTDKSISLGEFLKYAAKQDWIDTSKLEVSGDYLDSNEIFNALLSNIKKNLSKRTSFGRIVYKYMLLNDQLSPDSLCRILYDQGVLKKDDADYQQYMAGRMSSYDLMRAKIKSLEITPAQLALDPCSGSIVITDPSSGEVRALITYPGYDNNRLANDMDTAYYNKLYNDLSTPFYNKATQQLTAPGSTFKPVSAAAGLNEHVVNTDTYINCTGLFGEGLVDKSDQLHCWLRTGHGNLNVIGAVENSCNVYFATVAYKLGQDASGKYVSSGALSKIQEYSAMFGLDQKTNLEIPESKPHVSDALPLPSAIGQGTHQYTTSQIARYASAIANSGTIYDLRLLSKTTDANGNILKQYSPQIAGKITLSDTIWNVIHTGMRGAKMNNSVLRSVPLDLKIKTGTAQEANNRPSHSLVMGYSHNNQAADIAFTVRIAFGYGSSNACLVAKDILSYYYNLTDEAQLLTGTAAEDGVSGRAVVD